MSSNRTAAIDFCNIGIAHKRAGNYQQSLNSYLQAEKADPGFDQVYMNKGKLLLGCGRYADAFANLLVYGHMHMIDKTYNNPAAKSVVEGSSIPSSYVFGNSPERSMAKLSLQMSLQSANGQRHYWQTYGEINLTRFAGACMWAQQPNTASKYATEIKIVQSMVMGQGGQLDGEVNAAMQTEGYFHLTTKYRRVQANVFSSDMVYEMPLQKIPVLYLN